MLVTTLTTESGTVIDPSVAAVERAVRALDGRERTMVVLGTDGPAHMAIGGGPARVIAYATLDGSTFSALTDPLAPDGAIRLIAGGEEDEYPTRETVDLRAALRAARMFTLSGTLDHGLSWQRSNRDAT